MKPPGSSLEEMLEVNTEQARFYDEIQRTAETKGNLGYDENRCANPLTRFWAALRHRQQASAAAAGLEQLVKQANLKWVNSHPHATVLEIGCLAGSQLTFELMRLAEHYWGVELSPVAISALKRKVQELGLQAKATLIAGDFLASRFDRRFDVVYTHGVLHHFANPEVLFKKLADLITPGGLLVFVEPSACNPLYGGIRKLYRPFQSDAAWEWPFTRRTLAALETYFSAIEGFGWGRYSLPLSLMCSLPVLSKITTRVYVRAVQYEAEQGWHSGVWSNTTVTAAYRLKGSPQGFRV